MGDGEGLLFRELSAGEDCDIAHLRARFVGQQGTALESVDVRE